MVESTALEMRRGCKPTVGSNPTLSATNPHSMRNLKKIMQTCTAEWFAGQTLILPGQQALPYCVSCVLGVTTRTTTRRASSLLVGAASPGAAVPSPIADGDRTRPG